MHSRSLTTKATYVDGMKEKGDQDEEGGEKLADGLDGDLLSVSVGKRLGVQPHGNSSGPLVLRGEGGGVDAGAEFIEGGNGGRVIGELLFTRMR